MKWSWFDQGLVRTSNVQPGDTVRVIVTSASNEKLERARELSADDVDAMGDIDQAGPVGKLTVII